MDMAVHKSVVGGYCVVIKAAEDVRRILVRFAIMEENIIQAKEAGSPRITDRRRRTLNRRELGTFDDTSVHD